MNAVEEFTPGLQGVDAVEIDPASSDGCTTFCRNCFVDVRPGLKCERCELPLPLTAPTHQTCRLLSFVELSEYHDIPHEVFVVPYWALNGKLYCRLKAPNATETSIRPLCLSPVPDVADMLIKGIAGVTMLDAGPVFMLDKNANGGKVSALALPFVANSISTQSPSNAFIDTELQHIKTQPEECAGIELFLSSQAFWLWLEGREALMQKDDLGMVTTEPAQQQQQGNYGAHIAGVGLQSLAGKAKKSFVLLWRRNTNEFLWHCSQKEKGKMYNFVGGDVTASSDAAQKAREVVDALSHDSPSIVIERLRTALNDCDVIYLPYGEQHSAVSVFALLEDNSLKAPKSYEWRTFPPQNCVGVLARACTDPNFCALIKDFVPACTDLNLGQPSAPSSKVCTACSTANHPQEIFCTNCAAPLNVNGAEHEHVVALLRDARSFKVWDEKMARDPRFKFPPLPVVGTANTGASATVPPSNVPNLPDSLRALLVPASPSQAVVSAFDSCPVTGEPQVLLHGTATASAVSIARNGIDPGKLNPASRFGPGFYCTTDLETAKSYASSRGKQLRSLVVVKVKTGTPLDLAKSTKGSYDWLQKQGKHSIRFGAHYCVFLSSQVLPIYTVDLTAPPGAGGTPPVAAAAAALPPPLLPSLANEDEKLKDLWRKICNLRQCQLDTFKQRIDHYLDLANDARVASELPRIKLRLEREKSEFKRLLPVYACKKALTEHLKTHTVSLISAPTGSGKTTQIPQWLADDLGTCGPVVVLVPTREMARSAYKIVREQRGLVGDKDGDVAYWIGYGERAPELVSGDFLSSFCIVFMTHGLFLQLLQGKDGDKENKGPESLLAQKFGAIVFDEAHYRSKESDAVLSVLHKCIRAAQQKNPSLRLVLMSATLMTKELCEYLKDIEPKPYEIPGDLYEAPIATHYLAPHSSSSLSERMTQCEDVVLRVLDACDKDAEFRDANLIVFLPGVNEINRAMRNVQRRLTPTQTASVILLPLYSLMDDDVRDRLAKFDGKGVRRLVVFSTNVAEAGITIPGVRYVIDCCLEKKEVLDKDQVPGLELCEVSQHSAQQRAGRCGRGTPLALPGRCIRVMAEESFAKLVIAREPSSLAQPLEGILLRLLRLSDGKYDLPMLFRDAQQERVFAQRRDQALGELRALEALEPSTNKATELGNRMARLPFEPALSRFVLEASNRDSRSRPLAIAIAFLVTLTRLRPVTPAQVLALQKRTNLWQPDSHHLTLAMMWDAFQKGEALPSVFKHASTLANSYFSKDEMRVPTNATDLLKPLREALAVAFARRMAIYNAVSRTCQLPVGTVSKEAQVTKTDFFQGEKDCTVVYDRMLQLQADGGAPPRLPFLFCVTRVDANLPVSLPPPAPGSSFSLLEVLANASLTPEAAKQLAEQGGFGLTLRDVAMLAVANLALRHEATVYGGFLRDLVLRSENATDIDISVADTNREKAISNTLEKWAGQNNPLVRFMKAELVKNKHTRITFREPEQRWAFTADVTNPTMYPPETTDLTCNDVKFSAQTKLAKKCAEQQWPLAVILQHIRARQFAVMNKEKLNDKATHNYMIGRILKMKGRGWTQVDGV